MAYVLGVFIILVLAQVLYSLYFLRQATTLNENIYVESAKLGFAGDPEFKLFVSGDSIAAGVGAGSFEKSVSGRLGEFLAKDKHVTFTSEAQVGAKMANLLNSPLPLAKQDLVVLIVSSNDLFRFTDLGKFEDSTEKVLAKYSQLGKKLIIVGPGRVFDATAIPVILKPIYKNRGQKYAKIIAKVALNYPNIRHVSPLSPVKNLPTYGKTLSSDNFHPNDEGHRFWFDLIKTAL